MRTMMLLLLGLTIAAWAHDDASARQHDRRQRRDRVDRVEKLKQMRLLEELRLGEEEAVRFMAKRSEHEDRMKSLAQERNALLDSLEAKVAAGEPAALEREIARVLEQDRKLFDERTRHQQEMRKFLTAEQFSRLLVFERDFQMQVRSAMGKNLRKRSSKFDD